MSRIYIPSSGAEDWKQFLAEPDRQWKTGYSARSLAHCWEAAPGLPPEIAALFANTGDFGAPPELLIALPEHKVPLPGGRTESQNDVFALVRCSDKTIATTIEGKVSESFGQTLAAWNRAASRGKTARLEYLSALLGVAHPPPQHLYYQLIHRAASAIIEAERFKTDAAAMIVHSFSAEKAWHAEYAAFVALLGGVPVDGALTRIALPSGMPFYTAWASGEARFLSA
jgi:hypothetical protein